MSRVLCGAVLATATLLFPATVSATDADITVCRVQASDNGFIYIEPCAAWTSLEGNLDGWIQINGNSAATDRMLQVALSAKASGLTVTVRIDPTNQPGPYDRTSMIRENF